MSFTVWLSNTKQRVYIEEEETRMVQLLGQKPADAFKDSEAVKVSGSSSLKNVDDLLPPEPEEEEVDLRRKRR